MLTSRWGALGFVSVAGISLLCGGCATPHQRFDRLAYEHGFSRDTVQGTGFQHVVYRRGDARASDVLHVYLAGDGTPWRTPNTVARDPTPRRPVALRLAALDPKPVILVGRPCYHGLMNTDPCAAPYWTHERYSEPVVASLARAIETLARAGGRRAVRLFGYSGGGALAVLVAHRLEGVRAVVTVAGNLDPQGWAQLHGYEPLRGSLDPTGEPLPNGVYQLHLVGSADRNVPYSMVQAALRDFPGARLEVVEGYDHGCCWADLWPEILQRLDQRVATTGRSP